MFARLNTSLLSLGLALVRQSSNPNTCATSSRRSICVTVSQNSKNRQLRGKLHDLSASSSRGTFPVLSTSRTLPAPVLLNGCFTTSSLSCSQYGPAFFRLLEPMVPKQRVQDSDGTSFMLSLACMHGWLATSHANGLSCARLGWIMLAKRQPCTDYTLVKQSAPTQHLAVMWSRSPIRI